MTDDIKITSFMVVFEDSLDKLIDKIKQEYKKPKGERNKENLKRMAREAKKLRKTVRQCKEKMGIEDIVCPNCGTEIRS